MEKIDADMSLTVGNNLDEKIGTKWAVNSGQEIHLKAGLNVVIEAGMELTIKGPGGFVRIDPAGVTIVGNMVLINCGGAAGTGSGAQPDAPTDAQEAITGSSGQVDQAVTKPKPPTPNTYSSQAQAMQRAAESGAPTVEQCPAGAGGGAASPAPAGSAGAQTAPGPDVCATPGGGGGAGTSETAPDAGKTGQKSTPF
jgi:type VI secretion system secreted protein VgrG